MHQMRKLSPTRTAVDRANLWHELIRTYIATCTLRPCYAALVSGGTGASVGRVERRTADAQGMGQGGPAVIGQRPEQRVGGRLVGADRAA